jgi:hypothetical protein
LYGIILTILHHYFLGDMMSLKGRSFRKQFEGFSDAVLIIGITFGYVVFLILSVTAIGSVVTDATADTTTRIIVAIFAAIGALVSYAVIIWICYVTIKGMVDIARWAGYTCTRLVVRLAKR